MNRLIQPQGEILTNVQVSIQAQGEILNVKCTYLTTGK